MSKYFHFNPLAPRGARHFADSEVINDAMDFNPLAPRGARRRLSRHRQKTGTFQSTSSSRSQTILGRIAI